MTSFFEKICDKTTKTTINLDTGVRDLVRQNMAQMNSKRDNFHTRNSV